MNKKKVAAYQRLNSPGYSRRRSGKRSSFVKRYLLWGLLLVVLLGVGYGCYLYTVPAGRQTEVVYVYLRPGDSLSDLEAQLHKKIWPRCPQALHYWASFKGLGKGVKAGKYALEPSMSIPQIVDRIASGEQTPVTLKIGGQRTLREITEAVASHMMLPADSLTSLLTDSAYCQSLGLSPANISSLFVAGDYQFRWDQPAREVLQVFGQAYNSYWSGSRAQQAATLGLTPPEVATLASIVESESGKLDEYPRIAGLYLNRLHKGIKLQSDPTVKFALGDFSLRRILHEHLQVDSPYNTYRMEGLPPGPICVPRRATIDSVLRAEPHTYLYMCAKDDFSGYHNFATSYTEHLLNARRYQQALNHRGIK